MQPVVDVDISDIGKRDVEIIHPDRTGVRYPSIQHIVSTYVRLALLSIRVTLLLNQYVGVDQILVVDFSPFVSREAS